MAFTVTLIPGDVIGLEAAYEKWKELNHAQ